MACEFEFRLKKSQKILPSVHQHLMSPGRTTLAKTISTPLLEIVKQKNPIWMKILMTPTL